MAGDLPTFPAVSELLLRPGRPDDAGRITEYHHRCWQLAFAPLLEPGAVAALGLDWRAWLFDLWLDPEQQDVTVVVADLDGAPVGHTVVHEHEVLHVFVDPDRWGTGIGRRLLAEAERLIASAGFEEAQLHTIIGNAPAVALYVSAGWTVTDQVHHSVDGELEYDEHVLVKRLVPPG